MLAPLSMMQLEALAEVRLEAAHFVGRRCIG
jgi:hypothetical protein